MYVAILEYMYIHTNFINAWHYICICMYIIHTLTHTFIVMEADTNDAEFVCMYAYTSVYIYPYVYVCSHTCIYVHTYTFHTCMALYLYMYVHKYTHYTHIYSYGLIYAYRQTNMGL